MCAQQLTSIRYGERLAEIGAVPSIGSIGDSYDKALAETANGLYRTELIRRQGPWRNVDEVELATLEWVHWFNTSRLHGALEDVPPAEFEAAWHGKPKHTSLHQTQGDSERPTLPAGRSQAGDRHLTSTRPGTTSRPVRSRLNLSGM